eukprot:1777775-Rhodomonas_salina.1
MTSAEGRNARLLSKTRQSASTEHPLPRSSATTAAILSPTRAASPPNAEHVHSKKPAHVATTDESGVASAPTFSTAAPASVSMSAAHPRTVNGPTEH